MILLDTLVHRWYAWVFVALMLWAASAERGVARALRFWGVATGVALLAEVMSTETGFPYGRYSYVSRTSEMHLLTVPLFVSMSFGVVVWAGRALATAGYRARGPGLTILAGALTAAILDLVIDPMTLRGHTWFLDPLYAFEHGGWFGVPWTNFGGWILVSAVILWLDELLEMHEAHAVEPVRGPLLAAGICAFFVLLALLTGHFAIFGVNVLVSAVLLGAAWPGVRRAIFDAESHAGEPAT